MSNSSPIRTASTSRFTLSTFTLRTDATTYFPPGDDSRQVCKLSIIALVGQHFPVHLFQAMNCGPDNMVGVAGRGRQWLQSRWRVWRVFPGRKSAGRREAQKSRPAGQGAAPWRWAEPEAANTSDRHYPGRRSCPCPVAHAAVGQRARVVCRDGARGVHRVLPGTERPTGFEGTLLHGSSRRMSYHCVFQHRG